MKEVTRCSDVLSRISQHDLSRSILPLVFAFLQPEIKQKLNQLLITGALTSEMFDTEVTILPMNYPKIISDKRSSRDKKYMTNLFTDDIMLTMVS